MKNMAARIMEQPWAYRLWMAPFASQKLQPVRTHVDIAHVKRVLDVGCGPGTNTSIFSSADYIGIDINPDYTASANGSAARSSPRPSERRRARPHPRTDHARQAFNCALSGATRPWRPFAVDRRLDGLV